MDENKKPDMAKEMLKLIIESWRFNAVFKKAIGQMEPDLQKRYFSRSEWFSRQVMEALAYLEYRIPTFENQEYEPGLPLSPVNIDEFEAEEQLVVEYMLEPTIVDSNGNIIKTGSAILRRMEK